MEVKDMSKLYDTASVMVECVGDRVRAVLSFALLVIYSLCVAVVIDKRETTVLLTVLIIAAVSMLLYNFLFNWKLYSENTKLPITEGEFRSKYPDISYAILAEWNAVKSYRPKYLIVFIILALPIYVILYLMSNVFNDGVVELFFPSVKYLYGSSRLDEHQKLFTLVYDLPISIYLPVYFEGQMHSEKDFTVDRVKELLPDYYAAMKEHGYMKK